MRRRVASFFLAVGVLLAASTLPAMAQARLLSSSPADGASVQVLNDIAFEFDSLLVPDGAEVTITKLDGTTFPVDPAVVDRTSLTATVSEPLPSGNYSVGYSVDSADGAGNEGAIRVSVDSPSQALSGGLIAVIGIFLGLCTYLAFVFRADKRRRPPRS